jgi:asparagine synthase (glutamine-hydrolysing)
MCGIAGFVDFSKNSTESILGQMSCAVAHRGPDGQGLYFSDNGEFQIGLGHRRLSIIDLSTDANQPMHFNRLHLIFNGEIYNYNEIRNTLISKGHQFKTHSDTEVILHSWQEWGQQCIQQWHGMYTIAMYDEDKQQLICIRDRAGVKPFYYYYHKGLFLFGSELKSLLDHPSFEKKLNKYSVSSFLQY